MKTLPALLGLLGLLYLPATLAVPAATEAEIAQLLDYISHSNCEFERNGDRHSPTAAREHIENKYDYTRGYVDSSEDFIKYNATESSFSGRPYRVNCAGQWYNTGEWLTEELARIRQGGSQ